MIFFNRVSGLGLQTLTRQEGCGIELLLLHRNSSQNEKRFRKLVGFPWMLPFGGAPGTEHVGFQQ